MNKNFTLYGKENFKMYHKFKKFVKKLEVSKKFLKVILNLMLKINKKDSKLV